MPEMFNAPQKCNLNFFFYLTHPISCSYHCLYSITLGAYKLNRVASREPLEPTYHHFSRRLKPSPCRAGHGRLGRRTPPDIGSHKHKQNVVGSQFPQTRLKREDPVKRHPVRRGNTSRQNTVSPGKGLTHWNLFWKGKIQSSTDSEPFPSEHLLLTESLAIT